MTIREEFLRAALTEGTTSVEFEDNELRTGDDAYPEADFYGERLVAVGSDPKTAFKIEHPFDQALSGFYGVHIGDADEWLPVLYRDEYLSGDAVLYKIDFRRWNEAHPPEERFYWTDDWHVMDRTESPDSMIVFSRLSEIPEEIIHRVRVIPEDEALDALASLEGDDDEWD